MLFCVRSLEWVTVNLERFGEGACKIVVENRMSSVLHKMFENKVYL